MTPAMPLRKVGPVELFEIPGEAGKPCFVMLHGYGANARDLVPFAGALAVPKGATWLFPNGLLKVPLGPGMWGRAWFPIDVEAMNRAVEEGIPRDLSRHAPPELKTAREAVAAMLAELKIDVSRVVFAGFSQGAMLATALSLYAPKQPLGLMILSGALLDEREWGAQAAARKGLPFYQSHGSRDELLSLEGARGLERVLTGAGLVGKLQVFDGGHEIPEEVVHGMNQYLKGLLNGG